MYATEKNLIKDTVMSATLVMVAMAWILVAAVQGPVPLQQFQEPAALAASHSTVHADVAAARPRVAA